MIIDYHTHVGKDEHWSREFKDEAYRMRNAPFQGEITVEDYGAAMAPVDLCIALAFRSHALGFHVPNEYVARWVREFPVLGKCIGFACVDPHDHDALEQLRYAHRVLGLRGVKISPIYQAFDPLDHRVRPIYAYCEREGLPMLFHQGATFPRRAPLKWAQPAQIEEIALAYPELRMIIAHLGHPWEVDTIAVLRKHPHVYSDVSGLYYRPFQFYHSMMLAWEYGVFPKLLFGSDYPIATPADTLAGIRNINALVEGTRFPTIPAAALEEIIQRDVRAELNLL